MIDFLLNHWFQLTFLIISLIQAIAITGIILYINSTTGFITDKIDLVSFFMIPFRKKIDSKYNDLKDKHKIIEKTEEYIDKADKTLTKIYFMAYKPAIWTLSISLFGYLFYGVMFIIKGEDHSSISFNIASLIIPFIISKIIGAFNEK